MSELDSLFEQLRTQSEIITNRQRAQEFKAKGDFVEAQKFLALALKDTPDDVSLQNEYAINLMYLGETIEARYRLEKIIDADMWAPSNYMFACDHLGIPYYKRRSISHLYHKEPKSTAKHDWRTHNKIRICYITSDARYHPAGRALTGIIKAHDKTRFEITMLYTGGHWDAISKEIIENADRFIDIGNFPNEGAMSNKEVDDLIQHLEIDVLIDLDGHTNSGLRLHVLSHRPAHLNISMLGYPCNINLPFIDMRIGSENVIFSEPESQTPLFSYCNSAGYMPIFKTVPQETRFKKDRDFILLGAISNPSKITHFDIEQYDAVLSKTPNTRLIYARLGKCYSEAKAKEILEQHSSQNRGRVAITNITDVNYLAFLNNFDILLDTTHWNLHATMIDAISCGVPVLRMAESVSNTTSSRLSADVYDQLCIDKDWADDALNDYAKTGRRASLESLSDSLFNKMIEFNNTARWVRNVEDGICQGLKRFAPYTGASYIAPHSNVNS
jgi:predicted O-linked N-acetylglucosamine transferase (SPINDLY family)